MPLDTFAPMIVRSPEELAVFQSDPTVPGGEAGQDLRGLVRSISDPDLLLACGCGPPRISRTGGAHWLQVAGVGLPTENLNSIAVDPVDSSIMFAEAAGLLGGLYRSIDGGASWSSVLLVPTEDEPEYSSAIAFDPASTLEGKARRWYWLRHETTGGPPISRLYRSDDAGDSWLEVWSLQAPSAPTSGQLTVPVVACHPSDGFTVYVAHYTGLLKSNDRGANFSGTIFTGAVSSIAVDPSNALRVWVVTDRTVARTDDAGATSAGITPPAQSVRSVFINRGYPDWVYLIQDTADGPPVVSANAGASWSAPATLVPGEGLNRGEPQTLELGTASSAVSPDPRDELAAIAIGGGRVWNKVGATLVESSQLFGGFELGGGSRSIAWDTATEQRFACAFRGLGVYVTEDGALSFSNRAAGLEALVTAGDLSSIDAGPIDLEPVAGSQKLVCAVGDPGERKLALSTDFGTTWSVPTAGANPQNVQTDLRPMFHLQDPQTIYAGELVSYDGGAGFQGVTWGNPITAELPRIVAMHRADCDICYAVDTLRLKVFRSSNKGQTWVEYSVPGWDLSFDGSTPVLEADPEDPDVVYSVDQAGDLARFDGTSWTSLGALPVMQAARTNPSQPVYVQLVAIDPDNPLVIWVGGKSAGGAVILRTINGGTTWEDVSHNVQRTETRAVALSPHTGFLYRGGCGGTWILPAPYASSDAVYDAGLLEYQTHYLGISQAPTPGPVEPSQPAPSATGWTLEHLAQLEAAIAEGALRVRYQTEDGEREVVYRTTDDMLRLRRELSLSLGVINQGQGSQHMHFSKGLHEAPLEDTFDRNVRPQLHQEDLRGWL